MVPKEIGFNQSDNGVLLLRAHIVMFFRLACHGKGWRCYTKAAFLSSRRHNLPSKVRLRNDQTVRNVYMWMQQ